MVYSTTRMGWTQTTRLRTLCSLGLMLALLLVSGCSHKTTVSEANTYLQAQALQIEINSYKSQLQMAKKGLTAVLPELQEVAPLPPESKVGDLAAFLENNDCTKVKQQEYCYKLTRLRLIQVTQALDASNTENWAAKTTIKQLVENINMIVKGLDNRSGAIDPPPTATVK